LSTSAAVIPSSFLAGFGGEFCVVLELLFGGSEESEVTASCGISENSIHCADESIGSSKSRQ
jgi:hypothetical protein